MEEVQLNQSSYDITLINSSQTGQLMEFFSTLQENYAHVSVLNIKESAPLLFLQGTGNAFLMSFETAQQIELERFFANSNFIIETERDLATILNIVPLQVKNITDIRLAKSLINEEIKDSVPFFKMNGHNLSAETAVHLIKDIILRGIKNLTFCHSIKNALKKEGRLEIYESIIAERFFKSNLYNSKNVELEILSSIYGVLSQENQKKVNEILELLQETSSKTNVALSSIITLQALEVLAIKTPKVFEEISHISGLNKKLLHSAVIRKILNITSKIHCNLKRDRALETILDALLCKASQESGIEKNLISNKHEILAFLNGNHNVDFMKGWKKSVFGEKVLDFLNGSALCYSQLQGFVMQKNEKNLRREG